MLGQHPDGVLVATTWRAETERGSQQGTEPCARLVLAGAAIPEH
jgi:hypothetical protein